MVSAGLCCSGDVQQLSEVAALGASKENVSDNAEVLSSLSQQLKQLITRADRLQQQHEAMLSATNTGVSFHHLPRYHTFEAGKRMIFGMLRTVGQETLSWHLTMERARWLPVHLPSSTEPENASRTFVQYSCAFLREDVEDGKRRTSQSHCMRAT